MEEWKEYKLGDVSTFSQGIQVDIDKQYSDYKPGRVRFIRIVDFTKNGEPQRYIDKPRDKCLTADGDIVMIRYGSQTAGIVAKSYDGAIANNIFKIEFNNDVISNEFGYYYLSQKSIFDYLRGAQSSSTMPAITFEIAGRVPLCLPTINIQNDIVSILKSLDDKIEVNRKINENLEQQAQALFKSWFVDFEPFKNQPFVDSELGMIPQGWRVSKLGDVCKCILGGTPSRDKEEYWNGDIAWINSGEVNKFRITTPSEYITEEGLKNSATKLLPRKTTVLAITGATLGQVSLLEIESCANQSVIGVLENSDYPYVFIYPLIKERIGELMSHMTGGAQQHINKKNVEGLDIVIPSPSVMDSFRNITYPIYERIGYLCEENDRLASLRDTLLPKLMSGELDVNEIENFL